MFDFSAFVSEASFLIWSAIAVNFCARVRLGLFSIVVKLFASFAASGDFAMFLEMICAVGCWTLAAALT